jgi:hypothetical protein
MYERFRRSCRDDLTCDAIAENIVLSAFEKQLGGLISPAERDKSDVQRKPPYMLPSIMWSDDVRSADVTLQVKDIRHGKVAHPRE